MGKDPLQTEEAYVERFAKALWKAQVDAGLCTTEAPVTPEMTEALRKAAKAAYDSLSA